MRNVVIIGGGASGMMAALTAAEDKENNIILLERQQRVGRKLLATGNGRCNLTNTGASIENYHGENPEFAASALGKFSPQDTLDFFSSLGLVTVTEYGGRVYPLSNSANSVVDVLRFAIEERKNITLKTSCPAREIRKSGEGFEVITDDGKIQAAALILACGGAAGAKLGGVTDGYELLKPLGHKRTALRPSLVQLICETTYPRALKGIRAEATLRLYSGKTFLASSKGELQFIEAGLSGPAAFDISRAAAFCDPGASVHIDFLDMLGVNEVFELLKRRALSLPSLSTDELLTGVLHNRLGRMVLKYASLGGRKLDSLTDDELMRAAESCKDFCIELLGVEGFDFAQVTAGGIKTSGVNPETLESWFVPNLYICGELLDIDADCGGFNLQWAWASGHLAGRLGK